MGLVDQILSYRKRWINRPRLFTSAFSADDFHLFPCIQRVGSTQIIGGLNVIHTQAGLYYLCVGYASEPL